VGRVPSNVFVSKRLEIKKKKRKEEEEEKKKKK